MAGGQVTQKAYEYDRVIEFTQSGGAMDQALSDLQKSLKELRVLINECEPLYHGKGQTSPVYNQYKYLYNNIGTPSSGLWNQVYGAVLLQNDMYTNAVNDRDKDQG